MNGLGTLVRLGARRNRLYLAVWLLGLFVVVPATATAYEQVIPDPVQAGPIIEGLSNNPTMRAMLGPPFSLVEPGGFTVWRVGTFVATVAGVMAILATVRLTRADEEAGRTELVRSGVVGRHVPLVAAVLVSLAACAVLGVLVTAGMAGAGTDATGSVAFGLGMALTAAVFVGVGAFAAQLTSSARTARGIALAVLGAAYLLRALADGVAADSPVRRLQWVSPVEWMALARPYADERWWVLLLPAALTAVLVALAVRLEARRDHGSGPWPPRPGPPGAGALLSSPAGLAWRLQRGTIFGWTIGLLVFSVAIGSLTTSFSSMFQDVPRLEMVLRRMGAGAEELTQGFFVAMLSIVVLVVAALGLQLLGRLHQEETAGHAEVVLSTAVRRTGFAGSHLQLALVVPTVLILASGALMAVPQAVADGDPGVVGDVVSGAAALLPGVWLVAGLGMLLLGWLPRLGWVAWLVVGWSLVVTWIGALLNLPDWLLELTPFAQLPQLPVEAMRWTPVLVTAAIAAGLVVLGLVGYRRRDLAAS
ncbi:ABC-2 type transport system permease protein [Georgenia soli]|uniref:ABC-2 type transport system permease protein n=1 Tax=Georgenia soli TaxID=638953 RepID=A0A2A9EN67_9MICO|nr:ABC transporter permease [Georgenia soli]PFG39695.1 ABC-2 type transport system permease protein [Georgenia soli]